MQNILIREQKRDIIFVIKWSEKGYDINKFNWGTTFEIPFKVTLESKIHWMQYQMLHRKVPKNNYLYKIKLKVVSSL